MEMDEEVMDLGYIGEAESTRVRPIPLLPLTFVPHPTTRLVPASRATKATILAYRLTSGASVASEYCLGYACRSFHHSTLVMMMQAEAIAAHSHPHPPSSPIAPTPSIHRAPASTFTTVRKTNNHTNRHVRRLDLIQPWRL